MTENINVLLILLSTHEFYILKHLLWIRRKYLFCKLKCLNTTACAHICNRSASFTVFSVTRFLVIRFFFSMICRNKQFIYLILICQALEVFYSSITNLLCKILHPTRKEICLTWNADLTVLTIAASCFLRVDDLINYRMAESCRCQLL